MLVECKKHSFRLQNTRGMLLLEKKNVQQGCTTQKPDWACSNKLFLPESRYPDIWISIFWFSSEGLPNPTWQTAQKQLMRRCHMDRTTKEYRPNMWTTSTQQEHPNSFANQTNMEFRSAERLVRPSATTHCRLFSFSVTQLYLSSFKSRGDQTIRSRLNLDKHDLDNHASAQINW